MFRETARPSEPPSDCTLVLRLNPAMFDHTPPRSELLLALTRVAIEICGVSFWVKIQLTLSREDRLTG
jgi:hypothetical protein